MSAKMEARKTSSAKLMTNIRNKFEDFYNLSENSEKYYTQLKNILSEQADLDLSLYREKYIHRRIYFRIQRVDNVNSYKEYIDYVLRNKTEFVKFQDNLTIHVTEFFRDKMPFRYLEHELLLKIAKTKENSDDKTIRILCAPCSSGEEPYSVAIIINFLKMKGKLKNPVEISAFDIQSNIVDFAKEGLYQIETMKNICKESRIQNFTQEGEKLFQIKPKIRNYIKFSLQDLLKPFRIQKCDLILCRNLLIYISKQNQKVVIDNLIDNLLPNGYLMLGKTEGFPLLNTKRFEAEIIREHIYKLRS
jgi:chemotaxis protein methyltransferase CheR